jgi:hypothetical protein
MAQKPMARPLPDFAGAVRPRPATQPSAAAPAALERRPAAPSWPTVAPATAMPERGPVPPIKTADPFDGLDGADEADVLEIEDSDFDVKPGPLSPEDVPIGRPLSWRICDIDGALLLDVGAVLPSERDRDFLFEQFEPQCDYGTTGFPLGTEHGDDNASTTLKLSDMGLKIGSRLGVRARLNGVEAAYGSRVIGMAPNEAIFITPPASSAGRLTLEARDTVQVVAVSARAVYLFICDVEFVSNAATAYAILSKPRSIRRVRERRAERIKTRFPVIFSRNSPADPALKLTPRGMGIANDISELGMALSTQYQIGAAGDQVVVRFYLDMHASTVCVEAVSMIRNVKTADGGSDVGVGFEYGLEFETLPPEGKLALHNFVLSHRSLG